MVTLQEAKNGGNTDYITLCEIPQKQYKLYKLYKLYRGLVGPLDAAATPYYDETTEQRKPHNYSHERPIKEKRGGEPGRFSF
ncbi:hypothetical protein EOM82_08270 [bacterium]|nr:hypothetical protein [bacterium]